MTPMLIPQLEQGVVLAFVLAGALAVVFGVFGAGYWYLVLRNHQGDEPTEDYLGGERGPRG